MYSHSLTQVKYWAFNSKITDKDRQSRGRREDASLKFQPCCCYDNCWVVIISVVSLSVKVWHRVDTAVKTIEKVSRKSGNEPICSPGPPLQQAPVESPAEKIYVQWWDALIVTHVAQSVAVTGFLGAKESIFYSKIWSNWPIIYEKNGKIRTLFVLFLSRPLRYTF